MKRLAAILFAAIVSLLSCVSVVGASPRIPDTVEVKVTRTFDLTIHADVDFTPEQRAEMLKAAEDWRKVSGGRVRIKVVFDLDFNSISNLREHKEAEHFVVMAATSDIPMVRAVDEESARRHPGHKVRTLGATFSDETHKPRAMFLVTDRITHWRLVFAHELGHVIGLPDLDTSGDVMSGIEDGNIPQGFTPRDRAACRAAHYCD